jgi:DNA-binding NtrC family response regulator
MKNVLIAGPCYADTKKLKKILEEKFPIKCFEATKLDESLDILQKNKIHLVLISRILAGDKKQGLDILEFVKNNNPKTQVIIMTSFPEVRKKAIELGALDAFDIGVLIGFVHPSMKKEEKRVLKILIDILGK